MSTRIRRFVEALKLLPSAIIVFLAYKEKGYYPSWRDVKLAVGSYFNDKKKLGAEVFVEYLWGFIPIGTLMCSIDYKRWLPVDDIFPEEMAKIRQRKERIGYFGKFAILPSSRTLQRLIKLIARARTWSLQNKLDCVLVIVNPAHVNYYRIMGFTEIARTELSLDGLIDAIGVLMILEEPDIPDIFWKYLQSRSGDSHWTGCFRVTPTS